MPFSHRINTNVYGLLAFLTPSKTLSFKHNLISPSKIKPR